MSEKYVPQVGDVVRRSKGTPGESGYIEYVVTVVDDQTGFASRGLPKGNLELLLAGSVWDIELIKRPGPPPPTKPNSLGWATWKDGRYLVRFDATTYMWDVYEASGRRVGQTSGGLLSDFEEVVPIPKKLVDEVAEWKHGQGAKSAHSLMDEILKHGGGKER